MRSFSILPFLILSLFAASVAAQEVESPAERLLFVTGEVERFEDFYIEIMEETLKQHQEEALSSVGRMLENQRFDDGEVEAKMRGAILDAFQGAPELFRSRIEADEDFQRIVREALAERYAAAFTPREMEQLIRFYATPLGQKVLRLQQKVRQDAYTVIGDRLGAAISELQQGVLDEIQSGMKAKLEEIKASRSAPRTTR